MRADRATINGWYQSHRWRRIAKLQLAQHPLCKMCEEDGVTSAATIADHVTPHKGDRTAFYTSPLQSLCKPHHDRVGRRASNVMAITTRSASTANHKTRTILGFDPMQGTPPREHGGVGGMFKSLAGGHGQAAG
jgi:hypothetical protein